MANLARFSKSIHCLFCLRRIASYDIHDFVLPFHRQLRGKKKRIKHPDLINVKLLVDTPGFGREGSIIPVVPGRMRNQLYPMQIAAYLSREELRALKAKKALKERDFDFMMEKLEEEKVESSDESIVKDVQEDSPKVQIDILSPQKATQILSSSIPEILSFYRTPIVKPSTKHPPSPRVFSPSLADPGAIEPLLQSPVVDIHGSVSVADIADEVRAILGKTEEGARVVLGAEDVTIVRKEGDEKSEETDRLKVLGDFEVDIQVKGGDPVRRTVKIMAEQNS